MALQVLLTCGDFCDELCRIVAALHYTPRPQWEVSTGLSPEQMGFNPLSCTGAGCKRQIHPWLRWAFSWARMNQPAIGFQNTSGNSNNSALHQNPHLSTALLCTFLNTRGWEPENLHLLYIHSEEWRSKAVSTEAAGHTGDDMDVPKFLNELYKTPLWIRNWEKSLTGLCWWSLVHRYKCWLRWGSWLQLPLWSSICSKA